MALNENTEAYLGLHRMIQRLEAEANDARAELIAHNQQAEAARQRAADANKQLLLLRPALKALKENLA